MDGHSNESVNDGLAQTTRKTREKFVQVIQALATSDSSTTTHNPKEALEDGFERFQLWVGSVGASIDAQRKISLEWRLRDAPEIKERILELQSDLIEALDDLYAIASGQRDNRTRAADTIDLDPGSDSETDSVKLCVEVFAVNETQDIIEVILDCIKDLLRLSILIRKATPRDRWNRALQKPKDDRLDDQFDIRHVGEKFPKLCKPEHDWLRNRLGRAITQRRQYIRYCRDHKNKMQELDVDYQIPTSSGVENFGLVVPDNAPDRAPITKALTLNPPVTEGSTRASTLHVATLEAIRGDDDNDTASVATSVVSSIDPEDESEEILRLPTLHTASQGRDEFECPLCFTIQSFRQHRKWKQHAYTDLKPYVCCGGKGECDLELFSSRNTWFTHELESHRHHWICFLCQREPINSLASFQSHVQNKHTEIPITQIPEVAKLCKRSLEFIPASECPFCDDFEIKLRDRGGARVGTDVIVVPVVIFRRHVAAHLEQLALFSLGPQEQPDEEVKDGSVESRSAGSVRDADMMKHFLNDQEQYEQVDPEQSSLEPGYGDYIGPLPDNDEETEAIKRSDYETSRDDDVQSKLVGDSTPVESLETKEKSEDQPKDESLEDQLNIPGLYSTRLREMKERAEAQPTVTDDLDLPSESSHAYHPLDISPVVPCVQALYDFEPLEPGELKFRSGDIIDVLESRENNWWKGMLRGRAGIFPLNYVEYVQPNGEKVTYPPLVFGKPRVACVRALFDFEPSEPGELQFKKGDIVSVVESIYDSWWKGTLRGQTGVFPVNYVQELPDLPRGDVPAVENQLKSLPRIPQKTVDEDNAKPGGSRSFARFSTVDLPSSVYSPTTAEPPVPFIQGLEDMEKAEDVTKYASHDLSLLAKSLLPSSYKNIELDLDNPRRKMVYLGGVWQRNSRQHSFDIGQVILLDNYFLFAKAVGGHLDPRGNQLSPLLLPHALSRPPIPMDLLVLEDYDQPPLLDITTKEGYSSLFPFRITHLGKGNYTLFAFSDDERKTWGRKIIEAKTIHAAALTALEAEPFRIRVLADSEFAFESSRLVNSPKTQVPAIEGTMLARALGQPKGSSNQSPVCKANINCATSYTVETYTVVVVGTDTGVYSFTNDITQPVWSMAIAVPRVKQVVVLPTYSLLLLLSGNELIAYPLEYPIPYIIPQNIHSVARSAPQKISSRFDVLFFHCCRLNERDLVIYGHKAGLSTTFKVLEPIYHKAQKKSKVRLLGRSNMEMFREYDEFYIPDLCLGFNTFHTSIAIHSRRYFEVMTLTKKQPWSVPDLKASHVATIAARLKGQTPLGMFRLASEEFLCCYDESAVYVNKHGDINRSVIMEYVGKAHSVALRGGYLLLFHEDFVEIRDGQNGRLKQIIEGKDIRCLDDGGSDQRDVKMVMRHPNNGAMYLILELFLP